MSKIIPGFPIIGFWVDETGGKAKKGRKEIFPRALSLLFFYALQSVPVLLALTLPAFFGT